MPEKKSEISSEVANEHGLRWNHTGGYAQLWLRHVSPENHETEELKKALSYLERVPKENEEEIWETSSGKKYDWQYHENLVDLIKKELENR